MKLLRSNIAEVLAPNLRTLIGLAVVSMLTLASSPGSFCGGGGYIADEARYQDILNFEDARRYWPTLRHIQWSADGSHVVFVQYSQAELENRIYVVASDGSDLDLIVEDGYDPSISPDGERVVYTAPEAHRDLPFLIETRKIDGSDRQRPTEAGREPNYLYPAWSPDGTRIAFARFSESGEFFEDSGIFTMAADGADVRWLLRSSSLHVAGPVWSPDGKRLAFTGQENAAGPLRPIPQLRHVLYVIEADASGLSRVYESPIREKHEFVNEIVGHPAWSPDGQKMAFILSMHPEEDTSEPPVARVVIINADGSEQRPVVEFSREIQPGVSLSWSPDGTKLLFSLLPGGSRRIGKVFVASTDGSNHREIGTGNFATWSPDSSRIAVVRDVGPGGYIVYSVAPDGSDMRNLVYRDSNNQLVLAETAN